MSFKNHPCTFSPIRELAGHNEAAVAAVPFRQTVSGEGVSTLKKRKEGQVKSQAQILKL
jgi:hypothetical protein